MNSILPALPSPHRPAVGDERGGDPAVASAPPLDALAAAEFGDPPPNGASVAASVSNDPAVAAVAGPDALSAAELGGKALVLASSVTATPVTPKLSGSHALYRSAAAAAALWDGSAVAPGDDTGRPVTRREFQRDLCIGLLLTLALWSVATAAFARLPHCSVHQDFRDECGCDAGSLLPAQLIYVVCFGVAPLASWWMLAYALSERRSASHLALKWPLPAFVVAQLALLVAIPAGGGDQVVAFVVFELVLAAIWLRRGRRARPLVVRIVGLMILTAVVQGVYHNNRDSGSINTMLALFPLVVNFMQSLLIFSFRRFMDSWASADIAVMGAIVTAQFEALRVGMLLAAIPGKSATPLEGPFLAALLAAVPTDVLSQNDLYWTGYFKFVMLWDDERVQRRMSLPKGIHIGLRYCAKYAPVLCLLLFKALGRIPNRLLDDCHGHTDHVLLPGWEFLLAILAAEIVTDALALAVNFGLRRSGRERLARPLGVMAPARQSERVVLVVATMAIAALALVPAASVLA